MPKAAEQTRQPAYEPASPQLSQEQKLPLRADQLRETPGRSNRWVGQQLGVHHATGAGVRNGMEGTGPIIQFERPVGRWEEVR
jgi:hypothetical protein